MGEKGEGKADLVLSSGQDSTHVREVYVEGLSAKRTLVPGDPPQKTPGQPPPAQKVINEKNTNGEPVENINREH